MSWLCVALMLMGMFSYYVSYLVGIVGGPSYCARDAAQFGFRGTAGYYYF
jgi:hypothetical protein